MMQHNTELVRACQNGDRDALRQLYEENRHGVFQLIARMVGEQEAADISQQVFVRAFSHIEGFEGRANIRTWLHRIAVNEALQFLRRMKREPHQTGGELLKQQQACETSQSDDAEILSVAMKQLAPDLKSIFLLREADEFSYGEIAEILEISEGTVASRLNRARRELRDILTRLGWEE